MKIIVDASDPHEPISVEEYTGTDLQNDKLKHSSDYWKLVDVEDVKWTEYTRAGAIVSVFEYHMRQLFK